MKTLYHYHITDADVLQCIAACKAKQDKSFKKIQAILDPILPEGAKIQVGSWRFFDAALGGVFVPNYYSLKSQANAVWTKPDKTGLSRVKIAAKEEYEIWQKAKDAGCDDQSFWDMMGFGYMDTFPARPGFDECEDGTYVLTSYKELPDGPFTEVSNIQVRGMVKT